MARRKKSEIPVIFHERVVSDELSKGDYVCTLAPDTGEKKEEQTDTSEDGFATVRCEIDRMLHTSPDTEYEIGYKEGRLKGMREAMLSITAGRNNTTSDYVTGVGKGYEDGVEFVEDALNEYYKTVEAERQSKSADI